MKSGFMPALYGAAFFVTLSITAAAVLAPWMAPYDPNAVVPSEILQHPSAVHWLGTDALGRDLLSRMIWGARTSVAFAAAAACCTMAVGLVLGMAGGYFGGLLDRAIQCLVVLLQGLPGMSLMIAIAAILPENDARLIIAVTVTSWTGFSRIVRSEVIHIRHENYIASARSLGASHWYILRQYVLPNVLSLVVVLLTLRIGTSLLSASALSYLGLGAAPPVSDWGVMVSDGRTYFRSYPMMIVAPGLGITLFCMGINLMGDWLRDRMDRHGERRRDG